MFRGGQGRQGEAQFESQEKRQMKCEEFEEIGLDAERDGALSELERAAAREHAGACSRCAALEESWGAARVDLQSFAEVTLAERAPSRVEMRLRQEFRTKHRTMKTRRAAMAAVWALAAAAVLVATVSWEKWETAKRGITTQSATMRNSAGTGGNNPGAQSEALSNLYASIPSEDDAGDFTALPGGLPSETEEAAIVRVRMQRSTLVALGFPVNEQRAAEWIQVDLMVGNDGLPQAVRLAR